MKERKDMIPIAEMYIARAGIRSMEAFQLAGIFTGLDFERYEILRIIPKGNRCAVIIQCSRELANPHFCVQYCGSGEYFSTWQEVKDYYVKRWHDNKLDGMDGTNSDFDGMAESIDKYLTRLQEVGV